MISVLVVDDEHIVRVGLRTLLDTDDGFAFSGETDDRLAAIAMVKQTRPDVVLMGMRLRGIGGLEATRRLVADPDLPETKVIMLTSFEHEQNVVDALRHGAHGFLVKDTASPDLLRGIRQVADGGAVLSPTATRTLIREFVTQSPRSLKPHPNLDALTEREREVLGLVAEGLRNDEIARRLFVSPATSRTHVSRAMIKLQARDRAQLVTYAYQSGIVS